MTTSYRVVELVRQKISNDFLVASDTDIARVLQVSRTAISSYKHGRNVMSPETFRLANKLLALPEKEFDELLLALTIEGTKEPELRSAWKRLQGMVKRSAAASVTAIVTAGTLFAPTPNQRLADDSSVAQVYIMRT